MHIEPGYIAPAKIIAANVSAVGVLAYFARDMIKHPTALVTTIAKTALAAGFFSVFMQIYHVSVGPSELHFVGASVIYLTLGFLPTLFGFALGLLLQGFLFEPGDLPHLAVNSLTLIVPLVAVHFSFAGKLFDQSLGKRISWATILKLDAAYYTGVTGMVGFWLFVGEVATPFSAWAAFAGSYLVIVACEPIVTYFAIKGLKSIGEYGIVAKFTVVRELRLS